MERVNCVVDKVCDALDKLIYVFGGAGLIVAIAIYAFNIWDWWLFGKRIAAADEIALMGLVWTSYVGMGLLFRQKGHCTMDFVVEMCSEKFRPVLDIVRDILILAVALAATYYSWKLSIKSFNKLLTISKIPYFYCDIAFTIGYAHLVLVVVVDFVRNVLRLFTHEKGGVAE